MKVPSASCGLTFPCPDDLETKLTVVTASGYDFMAVPIVHPRYRMPEKTTTPSLMTPESSSSSSSKKAALPRGYAFTRSDLLLTSGDWNSLIVGIVSRDLNLESSQQKVRRAAEVRLQRELNYCVHLGLAAIMLPLQRPNNANLSRFIYSFIVRGGNCQVWMRVNLNPVVKGENAGAKAVAPPPGLVAASAANGGGDVAATNDVANDVTSASKEDDGDTWQWWNTLRGSSNTEKRLFLALVVDKAQPPDETLLNRWLGEPVKALILSTSLFLPNKNGFPVLPRSVQTIVKRFVALKVQYIIEGRNQGHDVTLYQQYLDHLVKQASNEQVDPLKQFATGYEDFLQSPLQPLMDNLESSTYEIFEKDPIKYTEYHKAMYKALLDRVTDEEANAGKRITLMVLGAGRGPLVRAALKAGEQSGRQKGLKVYAVEKNPNAIVTLLDQKERLWGDRVEVISGDMREWRPSSSNSSDKDDDIRADIVVSELLGSFGDNELSPECLYSAENLFKPDAVSIPCSYTSWIGPLQSSKLYNEVRASVDADKNPQAHFETPYVVHLQNRTELAKPQPLFTFDHPSQGQPVDNTRFATKHFRVTMDSVLHGFGGYFECQLYKDVMISINPATHSKGMFSWFPIFFPLSSPVHLRQGDEVELNFWRMTNAKHVWYEWNITKPLPLPIHNPNGRSYEIGL